MLGDNILVAPIVNEGSVKRDIYLPKGNWTDQNYGDIKVGPTLLRDYPVPLNMIPYFIKKD